MLAEIVDINMNGHYIFKKVGEKRILCFLDKVLRDTKSFFVVVECHSPVLDGSIDIFKPLSTVIKAVT